MPPAGVMEFESVPECLCSMLCLCSMHCLCSMNFLCSMHWLCSTGGVMDRVVSQLLTEIDEVQSLKGGIFIIGGYPGGG